MSHARAILAAVDDSYVIQARGLTKSFGKTKAVDNLSLEVKAGTVLGLLGPNGAGKTTTVRMLATLLPPDAGDATVAGFSIRTQANELRRNIGLTGQYAAVDEYLSGRENLEMVGRLYHLPKKFVLKRSDELLERFDLVDAAKRPVKTYSGGMRRRLDLAASLMATPKVLFLDEPTTGLDPRSRIAVWKIVEELVAVGTTVLLTTQYLEEADQLADEIVVIDHGRVIARGTADELKTQVGGERIEITLSGSVDVQEAANSIRHFGESVPEVDPHRKHIIMPVVKGASKVPDILSTLSGMGAEIDDFGLRKPTLDEVFLSLTGRKTEDDDNVEVSK